MEVVGLVFDAEDVLYDSTVWRRWLLQLLARMGLHTSYQAFYRVWEREFLDDVNRGRREYWDALRNFLRSAGLLPRQIDEVLAAGHARFRQLQQQAYPLPGVVATLALLAGRGVPLGIISNVPWSADRIEEKLRKLGFLTPFQTVISSVDVGSTMPAGEGYRTALAELHLEPAGVAFVGHDDVEISGAAKVGMPTIAFNYGPKTRADLYLERFEQLPQVVNFKSHRLLAG